MSSSKKPSISVIIPTYNEAENIVRLVQHIRQSCETKSVLEIIVADGGSTDQTVEYARKLRTKTVMSATQRAVQLNNGAAHAKGSILYFVHADSLPPSGFDTQILNALDEGHKAGCFRLRFDDRHWLLRSSQWITRFNWNWLRFGDQSLFTDADTFKKVGSFNENMLVNEDREIVDRLKKRGTFTVMPDYIITSARKYRQYGYFRLQLFFVVFNSLYNAGVSQGRLVAMYQRLLSRHQS